MLVLRAAEVVGLGSTFSITTFPGVRWRRGGREMGMEREGRWEGEMERMGRWRGREGKGRWGGGKVGRWRTLKK